MCPSLKSFPGFMQQRVGDGSTCIPKSHCPGGLSRVPAPGTRGMHVTKAWTARKQGVERTVSSSAPCKVAEILRLSATLAKASQGTSQQRKLLKMSPFRRAQSLRPQDFS